MELMRNIVLMQYDRNIMEYWRYRSKSEDAKAASRKVMKEAQQNGYGTMFRRLLEKVSSTTQIHRAHLLVAYIRRCIKGERGEEEVMASQLGNYRAW